MLKIPSPEPNLFDVHAPPPCHSYLINVKETKSSDERTVFFYLSRGRQFAEEYSRKFIFLLFRRVTQHLRPLVSTEQAAEAVKLAIDLDDDHAWGLYETVSHSSTDIDWADTNRGFVV